MLQPLGQGFALHEFHDDVEPVLFHQKFADLDNVGVLEAALNAGFIQKTFAEVLTEHQFGIDGFDGDDFRKHRVHAAVDNPHAAARDFTFQSIAGDLLRHRSVPASRCRLQRPASYGQLREIITAKVRFEVAN